MNTAVGMLEQELLIPNLFQEQGVDQFKGAENDTISMKVEGILPFHDYAWRNDRSKPIVFDEYAERTIAVTFGGNVYSAVKLTDEQNDFDIDNWSKLLRPQSKAVARGLQRPAVNLLTGQTCSATILNAQQNLRPAMGSRLRPAVHAGPLGREHIRGLPVGDGHPRRLGRYERAGGDLRRGALRSRHQAHARQRVQLPGREQ
ncbi:hypothetical protein [Streptomyces sp. KR55]|uniref:hypothetical protein n=1 Tax=Streptomyces sp. KR55 TaxID=3457425 RepID=UPI003FD3EA7C